MYLEVFEVCLKRDCLIYYEQQLLVKTSLMILLADFNND